MAKKGQVLWELVREYVTKGGDDMPVLIVETKALREDGVLLKKFKTIRVDGESHQWGWSVFDRHPESDIKQQLIKAGYE